MDSNLTDLAYVEETTFGTTPAASLQIMRTTGHSFPISQNTVSSEEVRSDLRGGKPVRTSQTAQGTANVEWSYGTLDDILEGMLMEAWAANVLVDGTTKKSYTFVDRFIDADISPSQYLIYKGSRIGSLSMSMAVGAIVKGSFGIQAAIPSLAQTQPGSGSTDATTTGPWNCVDMVTALQEESASITKVVGVDLNMQRGLRFKQGIGSLPAFDIGVGKLVITGTIQQYFEDATLMDAFLAFGDRTIDITFTDEATNAFAIHIPKVKYTGQAEVTHEGVDGDRYVRVPFEAYANAGDPALIQFTRTPA